MAFNEQSHLGMSSQRLVRVRILFFGKARELAGREDQDAQVLTGLDYEQLKNKVFQEVFEKNIAAASR